MQSTDDELPAQVIDTEDYTDETDDEPEEEWMKASNIDFVVGYLLADQPFAEWYFGRNRWDEVEQKYDIERKRLSQPEHRKPVVVDMAAMRKKPKEHNQRLFPAMLQCVRENPGITASEINAKLGRTKQQESSVYKCIERNMERFTVVPVKCIGGTRYRFYLRQDAKQLQEIENVK